MKKTKRRTAIVPLTLTLIAQLALGVAWGIEPKAKAADDGGGAVGAMTVEAVTTTATVTAIDYPTRMITLRRADGTDATFRVGPEAVNFDQIKVGDQVKATSMKSLAIYSRKPGDVPGTAAQQTIAVAPKGAMPGVMVANTSETTAKVIAIDLRKRMVELQTADGKNHTVQVGPKVDLSAVQEGDDVVFRSTERLVIRVERFGAVGEKNAPPTLRDMIVAEGITTDATITALDKAGRSIALKRPDGSEQTFRAGNGVLNFDKLETGDEVKATLIEEQAIDIRKPDAPVPAGETDSVAIAPGDASANAAIAPVRQATLKIRAIDAEERNVTLQDDKGDSRIIHVAPRMNLEGLKAGDEVVVRMTPGVIVAVEKVAK